MAPRWIRRLVLVLFVAGIVGMIVASITDSTGAALTFGLLTSAAALALILVTSVAGPEAFGGPDLDEQAAAEVEEQAGALVTAGADEDEVRRLIRLSVRLGRSMR